MENLDQIKQELDILKDKIRSTELTDDEREQAHIEYVIKRREYSKARIDRFMSNVN